MTMYYNLDRLLPFFFRETRGRGGGGGGGGLYWGDVSINQEPSAVCPVVRSLSPPPSDFFLPLPLSLSVCVYVRSMCYSRG